jgi:hypothetical protein
MNGIHPFASACSILLPPTSYLLNLLCPVSECHSVVFTRFVTSINKAGSVGALWLILSEYHGLSQQFGAFSQELFRDIL